MKKFIFTYLILHAVTCYCQCNAFGCLISKTSGENIPYTKIYIVAEENQNFQQITITDEFGRFKFENLPEGNYILSSKSNYYKDVTSIISLKKGTQEFKLFAEDSTTLGVIDVVHDSPFITDKMSLIDDVTLTHSKKTQEISIDKIPGNLANNNARELYATVPGLNIWESDGGGLQLGIGARGLSPNRTEHFNTRQNGYDISADALGYPESYYTPPAEAIQSIQFIRGAASLQFGPQFGGMVNFKLRAPSTKAIEYRGTQSYGAFNVINTFNSLSGTLKNRFSYLVYYNYKKGDGWRDNSNFYQHNAFAQLKFNITEKMNIIIEQTYMTYLAQQPGGLSDAMFNNNPRQSIRERNWFKVDWRILAANYNWEINYRTKLNLKFFKIDASRQALGNLDKITRLDDYKERSLISGDFANWGLELRSLTRYPVGKKMKGVISFGGRYYVGKTTNQQGLADSTDQPNFWFINPDHLENSSYTFPSQNIAGFFENMLQVTDKIWLSAGIRYEYIVTESAGYYRQMFYHPLTNELLFDSTYIESQRKARSVYLGGIGATYRIQPTIEIYSNIAQNYRGINFSDVRVINPNMQVDPDITDEKGFNADLGFRGSHKKIQFDASAFFLFYNNKIGVIDKKINDYETVRFRTNVGSAYSTGLELFAQRNFQKTDSSKLSFTSFVNFSYVYARYGANQNSALSGRWVELVPPISLKTGVTVRISKFTLSYLFSYVHQQYSDATNSTFDPNATAGLIPSYYVMDLSSAYQISKHFTLKAGVNNLTNNSYYTRRATGYPGPGIIPADGIAFHFALSIKL